MLSRNSGSEWNWRTNRTTRSRLGKTDSSLVQLPRFVYNKHALCVAQNFNTENTATRWCKQRRAQWYPGPPWNPLFFSTAVSTDIFSRARYLGYLTMIKYICYIYSWCPGDALDKVAKCKWKCRSNISYKIASKIVNFGPWAHRKIKLWLRPWKNRDTYAGE